MQWSTPSLILVLSVIGLPQPAQIRSGFDMASLSLSATRCPKSVEPIRSCEWSLNLLTNIFDPVLGRGPLLRPGKHLRCGVNLIIVFAVEESGELMEVYGQPTLFPRGRRPGGKRG